MAPVMASWLDVMAWCAACEIAAEPWERRALVRLAHARAMVHFEAMSKARGDQSPT